MMEDVIIWQHDIYDKTRCILIKNCPNDTYIYIELNLVPAQECLACVCHVAFFLSRGFSGVNVTLIFVSNNNCILCV